MEKKKAARLLLRVRLRATNSARFSCFAASRLFSLAEFADGCELRGEGRQLGFDGRDFLLVLRLGARFLGALQGLGRLGLVQVVTADRGVGEHGHQLGLHLEDSARDEDELLLAAARRLDPHRSGLDARDERRVARVDAELARFAGEHDELGLARVDARFGRDYVYMYRIRHLAFESYRLLQTLRLLEGFLDRADHVEGLLGERVAFARHDHLEAPDRVLQLDVLAFLAGEVLRHAERLRQEALDFPRARDRELVLGGELVHAEDRDDVAQLLVALQRRLHRARGVVVVLADGVRVDLARGRVERVDRRVDAERGDVAREHHGRVEMAEGGGGRRVGEVVGRHVDRLHRSDRTGLGRSDALLQAAHFLGEGGLVSHCGGHAAEQRRHLRTREGEAVDVVDEEQDVAAFVTEILRHGEAGEPHAQAEYFRDEGRDILFFVDNIYRFTLAGTEVSALLGRMPSAVGYQPTLAEEMGRLQERITSTKTGSITSIQAVYVPADDLT